MEKILITGAGGFIGSHLAELCVKRGYNVRALVRYNSKNTWGWLEKSEHKQDMEVVAGDVRDCDAIENAMKGRDTVFHLAALIGIPYSYVSPLAYIKTNVEGTYNILHCAARYDMENILITSTSETYGTAQYAPIDENHPMVGQSPYSATKIAADQLALSYYKSFEAPVKVVRPFNTYGPRQSARAIIPTVITQALSGQRELKLGNLSPTRDLTFVKDTASGFLEIAKSDRLFGEITHIGMNDEISIGDLVKKIVQLVNVEIRILKDDQRVRPGKSEVERLRCENSKIMAATDWRPQYNIHSGIEKTVDWFRSNLDIYKQDIYNV